MAFGFRFLTTNGWKTSQDFDALKAKATQNVFPNGQSGAIAYPGDYANSDTFAGVCFGNMAYPVLWMRDNANRRLRWHSPYGVPDHLRVFWFA